MSYHLLNANCCVSSTQLTYKVLEGPLNLLKAQNGVLHSRWCTYRLNSDL